MKKLKPISFIMTLVIAFSLISGSVFAASDYETPAQALAGILDCTVSELTKQCNDGEKTLAAIAKAANKLDEFQKAVVQIQKDRLAKRVLDKEITQKQADTILKAFTDHQADCDGTAKCTLGYENCGFGNGDCWISGNSTTKSRSNCGNQPVGNGNGRGGHHNGGQNGGGHHNSRHHR